MLIILFYIILKKIINIDYLITCFEEKGVKNKMKGYFKKGLVCGIIFLFLGASAIPCISANTGKDELIKNNLSTFDLYDEVHVNNNYINHPNLTKGYYLTIQEGIKYVNLGGTVYVHNGTYYAQDPNDIIIDKTLKLIGENEDEWGNDTIIPKIDGNYSDQYIIEIKCNDATIEGFNITQSRKTNLDDSGIYLSGANNNLIYNNEIFDNNIGIYLHSSTNNTISHNNISNCTVDGIYIRQSNNNNINWCNITNCGIDPTEDRGHGIFIEQVPQAPNESNKMEFNDISNSQCGVSVIKSKDIFIHNNQIHHCYKNGIWLQSETTSIITYNNIFLNGKDGHKWTGGVVLDGCTIYENSINCNNIINNYLNNVLVFQSIVYNEKNGLFTNGLTHNNIIQNKYEDGKQVSGSGILPPLKSLIIWAQGNYWNPYSKFKGPIWTLPRDIDLNEPPICPLLP